MLHMRHGRKLFLRGGLYHIALIFVCFSALNWGVLKLMGINIFGMVFTGVSIPEVAIAVMLILSAIVVLWNNWID